MDELVHRFNHNFNLYSKELKLPVKISNIEDFSENFIYLNNPPLKINSSDFSLKKVIPSSGLIIKNDPSIPFVYFSFILIISGTILSLIPTNQIWILKNKSSNKLLIGGLSNRNLPGFKKEFVTISNEIKNS